MTKYNNKKTTVDNIKFDSKKEAERYSELKLLERAGKISCLVLQPRFELIPKYEINGKKIRKTEYVADFQYVENAEIIIEDVKGMKTEVYKIKKKMFEFKYQTEIVEI